ncbi:hypothetical protein [Micromonospora sp. NPDC049891]|uniref:hypothetical protein n=1 Tax=Micromonospora sp. NPDC049891 TaxID=3155655 RepID=UPI00340471D8
MSDMIAKTTFFVSDGTVETCVRKGAEYAATDPVVKANKQFFEGKPKPPASRKRG